MKTYKNGLTSADVDTAGGGEVITKQAEARETDINYIISTYQRTGQIVSQPPRTPLYGDFTGPRTLLEAQELVREAAERFQALPSAVREVAKNDPVTFLEMAKTPDGLAKLAAAGAPQDKGPGPFVPPADTKPTE